MQASEVYGEAMRQLNEMLQDRESSSIEAYFIVSEVLQKNKNKSAILVCQAQVHLAN